ncbi:15350_t:CDS:2, partial [Acaulospora colombiana]
PPRHCPDRGNASTTMSKTPISIEDLLQKQKEEREAASKQDGRNGKDVEDYRSSNRAKERDSRENDGRGSRYDDRRKDSRHQDDRERDSRPIPTGPRADRNKGPPKFTRPGEMAPPPAPSGNQKSSSNEPASNGGADDGTGMSATELSAIRSRYLGVDKKKRTIRKISDRKFVFDWAEQDDTFAMDSPSAVGSQRQGAAVMFGRGHLAGMENSSVPHLPRPASANGGPTNAMVMDPAGSLTRRKDDRHWSEKPIEEMKDRDWRIFREDFSISARGGNIPYPLRSWEESSIPPQLLDVIATIGYKEPSPIQRQAIPIGLQNRDLIGIAETVPLGSGKTAAFVIPMLTYISQLPPLNDDNRHLGPLALILAPTRELAQQIETEAKKFATPLGFKCVSIVGGRAVEEQQFNLREGAEIIIATPGRLKDVIDRHVLVLSQCTYVVMDEADRMVHLGFEADLTFILDALPSDLLKGENAMEIDGSGNSKARTRVTTLFSATMPPAVERLARKYLKKAATITIGEAGRAVDTVEQRVEFVHGEEKK